MYEPNKLECLSLESLSFLSVMYTSSLVVPFLIYKENDVFWIRSQLSISLFQTLHQRAVKARTAKKKAPIPTKPKIQEPAPGEAYTFNIGMSYRNEHSQKLDLWYLKCKMVSDFILVVRGANTPLPPISPALWNFLYQCGKCMRNVVASFNVPEHPSIILCSISLTLWSFFLFLFSPPSRNSSKFPV